MHVIDQVLFRMPKDRELQFPAMAVLQSFVNNYAVKVKTNDVSGGLATYELKYSVDIPVEDWKFFTGVGLEVTQAPEPIGLPDVIFEFTEEKLAEFKDSGKHVCQVFGLLSGISCNPLLVLRQVKPRTADFYWLQVEDSVPDEMLIDNTVSGVIGCASWVTYLACCAGLPTIEILPEGRNVSWLSKFSHKLYRVVDPSKGNTRQQIQQAKANLEAAISYLRQKEVPCTKPVPTKGPDKIQMAQ